MDYVLGLDSGSTTTKAVVIQGKNVLGHHIVPTGANSSKASWRVFSEVKKKFSIGESGFRYIVATGYGRNSIDFANKQITEISCQAKGVSWLFPEADGIIDIGGQDFKVIKLNSHGNVDEFSMNEKCAAGTGRFLEVMARVLEMDIDDFSAVSASATSIAKITSVCTVFAETEVINHIAVGTPIPMLVAGIFDAVSTRVYTLAKNILANATNIVFTGGVAKNIGMVRALERKVDRPLVVHTEPQVTGALGAAVFALEYVSEVN